MGTNGKVAQLHKPFRNRITGAGMERVDQLLANPANWRLHPENQQSALAGAIDDLGFIRSVTVNRTTGCVLDGHLRVTLAARSGVDALPVEYVELSPAEEAEALLTLDPIGAMAAADKAKLDDLMRQVNSDDERVQRMIAELAEREHIQYGDPPPDDPGAQIDRAKEFMEKWKTTSGQMWALGKHRLLCGDSTKAEDVTKLMGGEKAVLLVTDPPYNVDKDYGEVVDDQKSDVEYKTFLDAWFSVWSAVSERQIITIGRRRFEEGYWFGLPIKATGCWTKTNAVSRGRVTQSACWEPIIFVGEKWDRTRPNDVFDFPVGMQGGIGDHPCPKPLKLWAHLIEQYSQKGDIIADAFDGAGTTIVACEQTERIARAIEIEPKYCAVAIERWAQMTGKQPELINGI